MGEKSYEETTIAIDVTDITDPGRHHATSFLALDKYNREEHT